MLQILLLALFPKLSFNLNQAKVAGKDQSVFHQDYGELKKPRVLRNHIKYPAPQHDTSRQPKGKGPALTEATWAN